QELRRTITDRFGAEAPTARIEELQRQLQALYRGRGYPDAKVTPRVQQAHNPDRASLVFDIEAGRRAVIGALDVESADPAEREALLAQPALRVGQPYEADAIQQALARQETALRARGYYEARAVHFATFDRDGAARVTVTLDRGPHVSLAFAGDPIPENERDRLVPVRVEASVDEDLLEDSSRAIENWLKGRGYRDAIVTYTRDEQSGELTVTFTVSRGLRYVLDRVTVGGNVAMFTPDVLAVLGVKPEAPFVQDVLDAGIAAVRNSYRSRGFARADVAGTISPLPGTSTVGGDRHVELAVVVTEGPRTRLGSIAIEGNTVLTEGQLRAVMTVTPGRPYSEDEIAADRDRIDLEYRNRGYDTVIVEPRVTLADGDTRADVHFSVTEGPQAFVDHVIVVGNHRTSRATIDREVVLKPGDPLGYAALLDSQQRLAALGLFRRVQISQVTHVGESRRDILVQVEEAPPTTIGYGGGVEGGVRLRPTGDSGQAEERFELAPRGFFEVGRRNLWGKNRAVNLFTRVSLRSRDIVLSDNGVRLDMPAEGSGYGFHEYRVYGTYREPRAFNTRADVLLTGILEQAIRSSFNFRTREVRAEAGLRLSPRYSAAGRYSFQHTTLFDERFTEDEKPLIDRLFPQVRLSRFATSFIRDTRDDVLYPNKGTFSVADSELAARAIGSEVGFVKTFLQTFAYVPLPTARRVIAALGARVGAAHGFKREVPRLGADGQPVVDTAGRPVIDTVQDLPASARFFAGGDTTVRGFSLDRLGDERTISPTGFPTGGNAEIVLNAELRVSIFGRRAEIVGFLDAGNVFPRTVDLDVTNLRSALGFGLRYRSPVGPIRVDLGFNVDRRELVAGRLERGNVLHISLGQAF
ncbi:MAG: POTRA domain-containing protein, partial [Vicinamibacterales bacterium]